MNNTYETYTSYYSLEDAKETIDVLTLNNIEFKVEENFKNPVGEFYIGTDVSPKYVLKIKNSDFDKANEFLGTVYDENNSDHYLNDYSTEDLKTVLLEYDKWHPKDVAYAKELLSKRGVNYSENDIEEIKNKRIEELSRPKEGNFYLIFGLYFFAIIGGLLGVFFILLPIVFGVNYYYLKKTLPNGNKVFIYDKKTRKKGLYLLYLSILTTVFWIGSYLYFAYLNSRPVSFYNFEILLD